MYSEHCVGRLGGVIGNEIVVTRKITDKHTIIN